MILFFFFFCLTSYTDDEDEDEEDEEASVEEGEGTQGVSGGAISVASAQPPAPQQISSSPSAATSTPST